MANVHNERRSMEDGHLFNIPTTQFALPSLTSAYLALVTQTVPVEWVSTFMSSDSSNLEIRVYEGDTFTGGIPLVPVAANRYENEAPCFTVFGQVVTTPVSVPLLNLPFFSKTEGVQVPLTAVGPWIFDLNQNYIMEIRNSSNQAAVVGARFGLSCRNDIIEGPFYQGGAD